MVQYPNAAVPFYRSHHARPYGLGESANHGVMVRHVLDRPLIMVPEDEDGWPQGIEESGTAFDVVQIVIRGIGIGGVHERTGPERGEIVSVPEVDDLIGGELLTEEQYRGQGIGVGPIPVRASDCHDPLPGSSDEHGEFQAQSFSFCKRP